MKLPIVNEDSKSIKSRNMDTDIKVKHIQVGGLLENSPSSSQVIFTRSYVQKPSIHS